MGRIIRLIALLILGAMLMTATVGCNTIGGMGEDIESGGETIEEHEIARRVRLRCIQISRPGND